VGGGLKHEGGEKTDWRRIGEERGWPNSRGPPFAEGVKGFQNDPEAGSGRKKKNRTWLVGRRASILSTLSGHNRKDACPEE